MAQTHVVCTLCSGSIVEASATCEGQDALFCEGADCQCWYHRRCVGVNQAHFQSLTESSDPFLWPTCVYQSQQKTILDLQDNVRALTAELLELKATVAALERSTPTAETNSAGGGQVRGGGQDKLPWNVVARGKKQGKGKGSTSTSKAYMPKGVSSGITAPQSSEPSKPPRVQVKGARRIWGTMKSATTAVVANVLKTLAKVPQNSLSVKRKYKVTNNNPKQVRWWFIVRGRSNSWSDCKSVGSQSASRPHGS